MTPNGALSGSVPFNRCKHAELHGAVEMCNVTQPALTKGVQKLEQKLGGQLIYRERQLAILLTWGKAVLAMLERRLASTESVRHLAREFRQKEVAPLSIGLAPASSAWLVLEADR